MVQKKHIHWFTLFIEHHYFQNNECPIFDLAATQETQRILKNYGIRFQKIKNEYYAYAEVASSKKIWEELNTADDLFFQLINTDPNFNNYTDVLLPQKENTLLYVTNHEVQNRFNEEVITSSKNTLNVSPLRFNITVSKTEKVSVSVKKNGQEIVNQISPEKQATVFINIQSHGTGVYEVWIDDVLTNTFYGTSEILHQNCYGILHIKMRNIVESLKENTLPTLKLNFNARATFREYIVVIPKDKKIEIKNMEIESIENEDYKAPEKRMVLGNQEEANVFTSVNAIQLSQKPQKHAVLKIQYTNQFSDVVSELDMLMPVPSTSSIVTQKVNNENVYYSQTIIYV